MNTSYNKEEDKYEGMTLDSKPLTPDPPNPGQVIYSDGEPGTIEKILQDYYKANIEHNRPNLYMIW